MNTVELFAGTQSFSKVAREQGNGTLTIDNEFYLNPDVCQDILKIDSHNLRGLCFSYGMDNIDILWASPPCQAFSVAAIGKNWDKETREPKSESALLGLKLLEKTIKLIAETNPKIWFIENPRGMMRKVIDKLFKKYLITGYKLDTVSYCRYGDTRMKPTDIWNNCDEWKPKDKMCHNGNKDHEAAPRGSQTGTQGIKGAKDRGVIPSAIFEEILNAINAKGVQDE